MESMRRMQHTRGGAALPMDAAWSDAQQQQQHHHQQQQQRQGDMEGMWAQSGGAMVSC
jgi:hypothetical protein